MTGHGARASDPATSRAAARQDPIRRGTDRWRVLVALVEHGPMTDFELGEKVGRQQTSAGKRRGELVTLGYVEDSDRRRAAPSGTTAIVWTATAEGVALVPIGTGRLFE